MQATYLHSSNGWEFDFYLGQTFLIKLKRPSYNLKVTRRPL